MNKKMLHDLRKLHELRDFLKSNHNTIKGCLKTFREEEEGERERMLAFMQRLGQSQRINRQKETFRKEAIRLEKQREREAEIIRCQRIMKRKLMARRLERLTPQILEIYYSPGCKGAYLAEKSFSRNLAS